MAVLLRLRPPLHQLFLLRPRPRLPLPLRVFLHSQVRNLLVLHSQVRNLLVLRRPPLLALRRLLVVALLDHRLPRRDVVQPSTVLWSTTRSPLDLHTVLQPTDAHTCDARPCRRPPPSARPIRLFCRGRARAPTTSEVWVVVVLLRVLLHTASDQAQARRTARPDPSTALP